jgi:tricarballylate dehydrogenase
MLRDEYRIARITKAGGCDHRGLADGLAEPAALHRTVDAPPAGPPFDPTVLDSKGTDGIDPPKSNWALPIHAALSRLRDLRHRLPSGPADRPDTGQVIDTTDRPIAGLYAAGELVGGLFWHNYLPGGAGLMAGAVFGRIAGAAAARAAVQPGDRPRNPGDARIRLRLAGGA